MAKVTEITVWTRGVVMDKEARDVANAFAQAAKMEGKYVQAFDNYEDLPDRVMVTTRKYARISDEEIEMKYLYTNHHPDVVVVVEPTIIKGIKGALSCLNICDDFMAEPFHRFREPERTKVRETVERMRGELKGYMAG